MNIINAVMSLDKKLMDLFSDSAMRSRFGTFTVIYWILSFSGEIPKQSCDREEHHFIVILAVHFSLGFHDSNHRKPKIADFHLWVSNS